MHVVSPFWCIKRDHIYKRDEHPRSCKPRKQHRHPTPAGVLKSKGLAMHMNKRAEKFAMEELSSPASTQQPALRQLLEHPGFIEC